MSEPLKISPLTPDQVKGILSSFRFAEGLPPCIDGKDGETYIDIDHALKWQWSDGKWYLVAEWGDRDWESVND
jgi:hypothetical protein